tara:strand:- start:197 stop:715 length:519 start_codon:yes stop_codon:yes gene_type:complete
MKHKHHIIPKHAGGTDHPSNLIELTIPEHAEAHRVLYEKYGRWEDRLAWRGLSGMICKEQIIWEIYKNRKSRLGINHIGNFKRFGMANKGRKLTEEHKAKINPTGRKQPQSQKDKVAAALSREYIITDPNGNDSRIVNLTKWCRENGLDQGNMVRVSQGKAKQHKGYTAKLI